MNQPKINEPNLEKISSLLRDMYNSLPETTRREKDEGVICLEVDLFLKVTKVTIVTYILSNTKGNHYFSTTEEALAEVNKWYFAQSYTQRVIWD